MGAGASAKSAASKQSSQPLSRASYEPLKGKGALRKSSAGFQLPRLDNEKFNPRFSDASIEAYTTCSGLTSETPRHSLPSIWSHRSLGESSIHERVSRGPSEVHPKRSISRSTTRSGFRFSNKLSEPSISRSTTREFFQVSKKPSEPQSKNSTSAISEDLGQTQVSAAFAKERRRRTKSLPDVECPGSIPGTPVSGSSRRSHLRPITNERSFRNCRSGSVSWEITSCASGAMSMSLDGQFSVELEEAAKMAKAASTPHIQSFSC